MISFKETFSSYLEMTKPRIMTLVCLTTAMGFWLAHGDAPVTTLMWTLLGTGLASAGASALNHCIERETDALMDRTKKRPIPTGKIAPIQALLFGIFLVLAGVFVLQNKVNLLAAFLVLLTAFLYVLVYTPLKKLTWLNTFVGSIPGALPPMVGWVAASGRLELSAYILFLILFAWQHPHFYALAWMYRDDYARGGLKMLPVIDPEGNRTAIHVLGYSILLLIVSILPFHFQLSGIIYAVGAVVLGLGMLGAGIRFSRSKSNADAKKLFRASLIYFPALFALIIIDSRL